MGEPIEIVRELHRLGLVIESAVRWQEGEHSANYRAVRALVKSAGPKAGDPSHQDDDGRKR